MSVSVVNSTQACMLITSYPDTAFRTQNKSNETQGCTFLKVWVNVLVEDIYSTLLFSPGHIIDGQITSIF